MPTPKAYFLFDAQGLSVKLTDRSSGTVNSRLWTIKDSEGATIATSVLSVYTHNFTLPGTYEISLSVTNTDGSDTFTYPLIVSEEFGQLNQSIAQMVACELPSGLALDTICFNESQRKWMLYLYSPSLLDESDVFNESAWNSLTRHLIAKLIVYDLVVKAAASSMTSYISAAETYNSNINKITSTTVQVADYTLNLPVDFTYPFKLVLMEVNGQSYGPSGLIANQSALLSYLNSLGLGVFIVNGDSIQSLGNSNIITTFNYTHTNDTIGVNTAFTQSNVRVVPLNVSITNSSSGSSSSGQKGPLKKIETGPSSAEWYDSSQYWSNLLRGQISIGGSSLAGGTNQSGIFGTISVQICGLASKLGYKLPMCNKNRKTHIFITSKTRLPDQGVTPDEAWWQKLF